MVHVADASGRNGRRVEGSERFVVGARDTHDAGRRFGRYMPCRLLNPIKYITRDSFFLFGSPARMLFSRHLPPLFFFSPSLPLQSTKSTGEKTNKQTNKNRKCMGQLEADRNEANTTAGSRWIAPSLWYFQSCYIRQDSLQILSRFGTRLNSQVTIPAIGKMRGSFRQIRPGPGFFRRCPRIGRINCC